MMHILQEGEAGHEGRAQGKPRTASPGSGAGGLLPSGYTLACLAPVPPTYTEHSTGVPATAGRQGK